MNGWKQIMDIVDSGLSYKIIAEIEPENFNLLREKSKELSRLIIEQEEAIVISGMNTGALFKLRDLIQRELNARQEPLSRRGIYE